MEETKLTMRGGGIGVIGVGDYVVTPLACAQRDKRRYYWRNPARFERRCPMRHSSEGLAPRHVHYQSPTAGALLIS